MIMININASDHPNIGHLLQINVFNLTIRQDLEKMQLLYVLLDTPGLGKHKVVRHLQAAGLFFPVPNQNLRRQQKKNGKNVLNLVLNVLLINHLMDAYGMIVENQSTIKSSIDAAVKANITHLKNSGVFRLRK